MTAAAWGVASEIEWNAARDRARLLMARRHGSWSNLTREARERAISAEYDAHAATELAMLLINRLGLLGRQPGPRRRVGG